MTAQTLPDALAIESARGAEHLAQIRAEGWRAGAEAMKAATLADIAARIDRGRRKYGPGDDSVLIMIAVENMVRSLAIPETPNG